MYKKLKKQVIYDIISMLLRFSVHFTL